MMKHLVKSSLQRMLGYRRYLRLFAYFKIKTLHRDSREQDFLFFLSLLPETGTVLDVGANLGFLTYYLARRARAGRVLAIEPMPDNLDALNFVVRRFGLGNVQVESCALGDHEGEVQMVLPLFGSSREQGLAHVVHAQLTDNNVGIRCSVPLRTLDGFAELFAPGVTVTGMKIDVENFEQFVLSGARRLLATHRPIVYIELMNNENRKRCFEIAASAGYRIKIHEGGTLVPFDPQRHAERINMFMVHESGSRV